MKKAIIISLCIILSACGKHPVSQLQSNLANNAIINYDSVFYKLKEYNLENINNALIGYVKNLIPISDKYFAILETGPNQTIKIFDMSGKYVRNLGNTGDGPGEYRLPIGLQSNNSDIVLLDLQLKRVTIFNANDFTYKSSFNLKYYYDGMLLNENVIYLKKQRESLDQVEFDILSLEGNVKSKIELDNKALSDKIDLFTFPPNNAWIIFQKSKLVYLDMTSYVMTCYDLSARHIVWENKINIHKHISVVDELKAGNTAGITKYAIYSLSSYKYNKMLLEMGPYYYVVNEHGEIESKIQLKEKSISSFKDNILFTISQPYEINGRIVNPLIKVFEVK